MAGYSYNYGTNQAPEYSEKPAADSLYGIIGTNTPGARQNQQDRARRSGGDPYAAFHDAPQTEKCWLIGGPCWHDGASLYAQETIIPYWLREPDNHERMFRFLEQDYTDRFKVGDENG